MTKSLNKAEEHSQLAVSTVNTVAQQRIQMNYINKFNDFLSNKQYKKALKYLSAHSDSTNKIFSCILTYQQMQLILLQGKEIKEKIIKQATRMAQDPKRFPRER